ncbi:acireductone dioxygenase [Streptomyces calidiresistens]|uniref:Acireductone dioxygenase n=1 Tax=Streptomyces calidiresistens TaxID=1485586 RepID=A0A7W3XYQ8_9ACTN|nr:cupin [Streptomyces calidiresistens]MBB0232087.1 cupin [Streptomyces calidiresistens]
MTLLRIAPEDRPDTVVLHTRDDDTVVRELDRRGVRLRRWPLRGGDATAHDAEALLALYREEVEEVRARESMKLVDVVRLHPEPGEEWRRRAASARAAFLREHRHDEDEVRFFAHGRGLFTLHPAGEVVSVLCEAGDLLSVPAGTRHWFDMGTRPDFAAIRFFQEEDGWVGDFTGSDIAERFPRLDDLVEADR